MVQSLRRYGSSALIATAITFGLFFLMQFLIATGREAITDEDAFRTIEMVRVEREEEVQRKERIERPPEVEQPPDMETPQSRTLSLRGQNISFSFNLGAGNVDTALIGVGDGEYLPIVLVQPIYPRRAQERGMEGSALIELTVNFDGTTLDPFIIEEIPSGYGFGRAGVQAAMKFKYQPRVVNGEPVPVSGVRYLFTFTFGDE